MDNENEINPAPSVSEPQETSKTPVTDSMQSDAAAPEEAIVSGSSFPRGKLSESLWSSPPQGVVVVSQDPVASLTVWLPGQVQDTEQSDNIGSQEEDSWTAQLQPSNMSDDLPELQPSTTDQESVLTPPTNKIRGESPSELGSEIPVWDPNVFTMVDGWVIPPQLDKAAVAEESQTKNWFGGSGMFDTEALLAEMNINDLNQNDFNQMRDEPAQRLALDEQPIIRSELQFSKGTDGLQTLSYAEEVEKQHEAKGAIRRFGIDGIKRKPEPTQRGLLSIFLELLRYLILFQLFCNACMFHACELLLMYASLILRSMDKAE